MTDEMKKVADEIRSNWHQMKDAMDSKDAALQESINKVNALNARIDELETKASRPDFSTSHTTTDESNAQYKGILLKAMRGGYTSLSGDERKQLPIVSQTEAKALSLSDDSAGGWLAYSEMVNDIIKGIINFSPVREVATVRSTSNRSIRQPVRKGTFAARWISETGAKSETAGLKYGMEDIPNHELYAEVIVSEQDLEDSAFDIEAEIRKECSEQFGVAEGAAFVSGDGIGKPEGLLTNALVNYAPGLGASALTPDGLIGAYYSLPETYATNATWLMRRATVGQVRTMKDAYGQYLWAPAFGSQPNTILAQPYRECIDMPLVSGNSYSVMFGDFRRGYIVVDRVTMVVKRLVEKYAESGQIALIVRKRVGGQVLLPEAMLKIKTSVS